MSNNHIQDRAAGAILGAWIGDALGLGPHWYYNLEELRRDYGDWIDQYTDPKPGRYHEGMKAGQLSQSGFILTLMVRSLIERNGYDEKDFCRRMDQELFALLNNLCFKVKALLYLSIEALFLFPLHLYLLNVNAKLL